MRRVLIAIGLLLVAGVIYLLSTRSKAPPAPAVVIAPSSAPATAPTSAPVKPPPKPKDYMAVVRLRYPDFPTTQPLMVPVSMNESARLIIDDPIYLENNGELWITRADAELTTILFKTVQDQSTHVTRENIIYVHRWPDTSGIWYPQLICAKAGGGYELVTRTARQDLTGNYNYDWPRAFSWGEAIVVPTDRGISIIRPDRRPMEIHHDFVSAEDFNAEKFSKPLALLDTRGVLSWMPWENGKQGSKGAARFVDEKWSPLDSANGNWPEQILHLVPLLDGSVLQLIVGDDGNCSVALTVLDRADVDEAKITALVQQLSDPDADKRSAAFSELTRYGSGIWPTLEKLLPSQGPAARVRLEQLLASKQQPTLGAMKLSPGPLKVVARGDFGSSVFYADAGVELPQDPGNPAPRLINPAWISVQPGRPIELLPVAMTEELQGKNRELRIIRGEFVISDDAQGPRWWLSNHFSPLLKQDEREFTQLVGQDGRGRWLFRRKLTDTSPTMIIDPTLPDPTPKLPVWVYKVEGAQVGWDEKNWPAIKKGGAWALVGNDWRVIDETKEKFYTAADPPPPATAPTSTASTHPTSLPGVGEPILVDDDGTRYYDGRNTLRVIKPNGKDITWDLPPEAIGSADFEPILFHAGEDRLFLFNSTGRVLRIRPTPQAEEPFKLEATFTRRIPNLDALERIWLDPAGRIIIAHSGNTLSVCFPTGRIPKELADKILPGELKAAEE
jgi:hypothetical protein